MFSVCLQLFTYAFALSSQALLCNALKHRSHCDIGNPFEVVANEIPNNAAMIQIFGPKHWLPADVSKLKLTFSPPLLQDEDFSIWSEPNEYVLPDHYQMKIYPTVLYVLLAPGKRWVKNWPLGTSSQKLFLTSIQCHKVNKNNTLSGEINSFNTTHVGNIVKERRVCPTQLALPGASDELQTKIDDILRHCQDPVFIQSRDLHWKDYHSLSLLTMQPTVMFVNGSDQSMEEAGKSVDRFLAPHSVLDVVWEPLSDDEPQFWILMPRPLGMPGHLFALLDLLQWNHPLVVADPSFHQHKDRFTCTGNECHPGCESTKLAGISGSGFSADAFNVYNVLRVGFMRNVPMQAFPTTLGIRSTPPIWEGVQGWTYAFQACESNFLDCYFLDHSPCPKIRYNLNDDINQKSLNKSRLKMPPSQDPSETRPVWWNQAVGVPKNSQVKNVPRRAIRDMGHEAVPTRMAFYSYLFRPKYSLRQNIAKKVRAFNLVKSDGEVCAAMHVRRGDVIFHHGQARFYVPLHAYVRASQAFMKVLNVTTILLLTDSQTVINEAMACEKEYPDLCSGITWRYVHKKRWFGAEGGWENPFPSGSAVDEFINIQLEFALAQQCDLMIQGNSGYGDLVFNHMCCKFPLHDRGEVPQRCICPPKIRLKQDGFTCEQGNTLLCGDKDKGGDIHKRLDDPTNMLGANFSKTKNSTKQDTRITLFPQAQRLGSFMLSMLSDPVVNASVEASAREAYRQVCTMSYDHGPRKPSVCRKPRLHMI